MSRIHEPSERVYDRTAVSPGRSRRTTIIHVCVWLIGLLLLIGLGVAIALWHTFDTYTATNAVPLPSVDLSTPAQEQLRTKLENCGDKLERDEPCELDLTAAEINAVLDQQTRLRKRVFLSIPNGTIQARVSIPFAELGLTEWTGRWLNGEAAVSFVKRDGVLQVHLLSVTMNSRPLPSQLQSAIAQHNLVEDVAIDAEAAEYLKRIDRVVVQDGKVKVTFKGRQ